MTALRCCCFYVVLFSLPVSINTFLKNKYETDLTNKFQIDISTAPTHINISQYVVLYLSASS